MKAGTVMGNILGVKKEDEEGPNQVRVRVSYP